MVRELIRHMTHIESQTENPTPFAPLNYQTLQQIILTEKNNINNNSNNNKINQNLTQITNSSQTPTTPDQISSRILMGTNPKPQLRTTP